MDTLVTALLSFFEEHRPCGKLDGGLERGMIWMTCASCDTCLVLDTKELPADRPSRKRRRNSGR